MPGIMQDQRIEHNQPIVHVKRRIVGRGERQLGQSFGAAPTDGLFFRLSKDFTATVDAAFRPLFLGYFLETQPGDIIAEHRQGTRNLTVNLIVRVGAGVIGITSAFLSTGLASSGLTSATTVSTGGVLGVGAGF